MVEERSHKRVRPYWLRVRALKADEREQILRSIGGLNTVCVEANCPNIGECWARKTATFMIMGNVCTRKCSFCAVPTGKPAELNPHEPYLLSEAVQELGLKHVVITSVNRDDLPDGGSAHFASCIRAIRLLENPPTIEVLTPDFKGDSEALYTVLEAYPEVFNHNLETVPRLYREVRVGARYEWSLAQLNRAKQFACKNPLSGKQSSDREKQMQPLEMQGRDSVMKATSAPSRRFWLEVTGRNGEPARMLIKSGLMLGLGEKMEEVIEVLRDLRDAGVDIVTIGQYLKPVDQKGKHEVVRYVDPKEFEELARIAMELGFLAVASGPLVRSSYFADEQFTVVRSTF